MGSSPHKFTELIYEVATAMRMKVQDVDQETYNWYFSHF
jgi:hypothetical protein